MISEFRFWKEESKPAPETVELRKLKEKRQDGLVAIEKIKSKLLFRITWVLHIFLSKEPAQGSAQIFEFSHF